MKKRFLWASAALFCLFLIFLIASAVFYASESASIGIIGGADGPTAIFVTSAPGISLWGILGGILGFLFLGIVVFLLLRNRHKRN